MARNGLPADLSARPVPSPPPCIRHPVQPAPAIPASRPPADRIPAATSWLARCAIPAARSRRSIATPRPDGAWAMSRRIGPPWPAQPAQPAPAGAAFRLRRIEALSPPRSWPAAPFRRPQPVQPYHPAPRSGMGHVARDRPGCPSASCVRFQPLPPASHPAPADRGTAAAPWPAGVGTCAAILALRAAGDLAAWRPACSFLAPLCGHPAPCGCEGWHGCGLHGEGSCAGAACRPCGARGSRCAQAGAFHPRRPGPWHGCGIGRAAAPASFTAAGPPPPAAGPLGSLRCFATRVFRAPAHE